MSDIIEEARRALRIEIEGLEGLEARIGAAFEEAVRMILACEGKVVVTGVGKSGHVARKIAATLSSTGTVAIFLHATEAIHGDLGRVDPRDVVLALSNSGSTEEVVRLLGPLRRIGVRVVAMTGNPESELARRADVHLDASVAQEACPLGLAPTASTTAALALGDALAVCLLKQRNFREEDFYQFHRGGNLGKKLLTTVGDLMDGGEKVPVVRDTDPVRAVIGEIQAKRYGLTTVVDADGKLCGAFSMGDYTRLSIADPALAFMERPIAEFMIRAPRTVAPDALAARALHTMEQHKIRCLIAVDDDRRPVGIIGLYEVLQAIDY